MALCHNISLKVPDYSCTINNTVFQFFLKFYLCWFKMPLEVAKIFTYPEMFNTLPTSKTQGSRIPAICSKVLKWSSSRPAASRSIQLIFQLIFLEPGFILTKCKLDNSYLWCKNNIGVSLLVKYYVRDMKDTVLFWFGTYLGFQSGSVDLRSPSRQPLWLYLFVCLTFIFVFDHQGTHKH